MDYFKVKALSASGLKELKKAPAKFQHWQDNPTTPTPAMEFGTAVHCFLLEQSEFGNRYAVFPEPGINKNTKVWKDFVKFNANKKCLKQEEFKQIEDMVAEVMKHPIAKAALDEPGVYEVEKYWEDDGVQFKCKLDKWTPKLNIITDYKTTQDASTEGFVRNAYSLGYHLGCAQYQAAYEKEGIKPAFLFITQEKEPPYLVNVLEPSDAFLARGIKERDELIQVYKKATLENKWEGYGEGINKLELPTWIS